MLTLIKCNTTKHENSKVYLHINLYFLRHQGLINVSLYYRNTMSAFYATLYFCDNMKIKYDILHILVLQANYFNS